MKLARKRTVLITSVSSTPTSRLLALFEGAGDEVAVRKTIINTRVTYGLFQHLGNRVYHRSNLSSTNEALGADGIGVQSRGTSLLMRGYGATDVELIYNGSFSERSLTTIFGQAYKNSTTNGAYVEFTTPDETEWVGGNAGINNSGMGIALVTIDGDPTLADLLPTAQDHVTAGLLDSSALVANGGTLNPTDRVWDQYSDPSNVPFSMSLTPGVHTIRLTRTGYKRPAAANTNLYIGYFFAGGSNGAAASTMGDNAFFYNLSTFSESSPADVISHSFTPPGASGAEWLGHTGSMAYASLPIVTVDGVTQSLNNWDVVTGSEVVISSEFYVRHTETGTDNLGTMDITFTLNKMTGLWISYTLTWLIAAVINLGYPCMMSMAANLNRARTLDNEPVDLDANDGSYSLNTPTNIMWVWEATGKLGGLIYVPDLTKTVSDWAYTTGAARLVVRDFDNVAIPVNKVYFTKVSGSNYTVAENEVWQSEANYRIQWFADANASLASAP